MKCLYNEAAQRRRNVRLLWLYLRLIVPNLGVRNLAKMAPSLPALPDQFRQFVSAYRDIPPANV